MGNEAGVRTGIEDIPKSKEALAGRISER